MPYYKYSNSTTLQHFLSHGEEGPEPPKRPYCLACYPILPSYNFPPEFKNFWNWIKIEHHANSYTGYTQAAFRRLLSIDTITETQKVEWFTVILQSIRYNQTATSFRDLTFHACVLFDLTHKFSSSVVPQQITIAQNYLNPYTQPENNNPIPPATMAGITANQMQGIFNAAFQLDQDPNNNGTITNLLLGQQAAINELRTATQNRSTKIVDVNTFHGREDEDPYEWLQLFEQAHTTNGWPEGNLGMRKVQYAAGFLRDAAQDWFQNDKANITR